MTREEMERLGALLFGYGWKSTLADALDVNRKTVSRWIADGEAPAWAADRLRAMAHVAPPPGTTDEIDRDDACQDAIEPDLTRLTVIAVSAGWSQAEVLVATLALSIAALRALAGVKATRSTLSAAIMSLEEDGPVTK
jgi:hypothetical protein